LNGAGGGHSQVTSLREEKNTMATLPVIQSKPAPPPGDFSFELDPKITNPAGYRIAFVILLDGDLVMSPEHLGVALMAAVLRRGNFSARIVEIKTTEHEQGLEQLAEYDPSLVCFTLMSINVETCMSFCSLLRARLPNAVIACGGPPGPMPAHRSSRRFPKWISWRWAKVSRPSGTWYKGFIWARRLTPAPD